MVNTNVQGKVELVGAGLRHDTFNNYRPGQYTDLTNAEIVEDSLRVRRPIVPHNSGYAISGTTPVLQTDAPMQNFTGFSGTFKNYVFAAGMDKSLFLGGEDKNMYRSFDPALLPQPPGGAGTMTDTKGHWLLGCFVYGDIVYYITHKFELNVVNEIWLFYRTYNPPYAVDENTLPASSVKILTLPQSPMISVQGNYDIFRKFFIHKDRLFILTNERLYFSKATDPKVFAVPDGGFIDVDSGNFFDALAVSDTIYISGSTKTYVYTYSSDPNKDGYLRPIYSGPKITSFAQHNETVYASSRESVFVLSGMNFDKVLDIRNTIYESGSIYDTVKMLSFGDSLVIVRGRAINSGQWIKARSTAISNILMFNTDNNSVSRLDFTDCHDSPFIGRITDLTINPYDGTLVLAVMSRNAANTIDSTRFYFMQVSRNAAGIPTDTVNPTANSGLDRVYKTDGTWVKKRIPFYASINGWAPDGSEYLVKRFRKVRLEGKLPYYPEGLVFTQYHFQTIFDGKSEYGRSFPFNSIPKTSVIDGDIIPFAYILNPNQRARSVSIRFLSGAIENDDLTAYSDNSGEFSLSVSDLRFYYDYTSHAGETREGYTS